MACHSADKHQPAAALVTGDTNTSFRSQQITFEKLTACYHSGWGAKGGGVLGGALSLVPFFSWCLSWGLRPLIPPRCPLQ